VMESMHERRRLVPKSRYAEAKAILQSAYARFADKWGHFDDPTCSCSVPAVKEYLETKVVAWR
jgi:aldehyde dehydrogenase (NAD+)